MRRKKKRGTQLADCGQNQEGPPSVFKSRGLRPWALLIGTLAPIRVVGVILFWSRHDFSRRCYWVIAFNARAELRLGLVERRRVPVGPYRRPMAGDGSAKMDQTSSSGFAW